LARRRCARVVTSEQVAQAIFMAVLQAIDCMCNSPVVVMVYKFEKYDPHQETA
jgi:hypothetical protein